MNEQTTSRYATANKNRFYNGVDAQLFVSEVYKCYMNEQTTSRYATANKNRFYNGVDAMIPASVKNKI